MTGQNPDPALQIKARIEAAFNNVPYPGDDNIAEGPRYEYDMTVEKFKGVRWQDWKDNPSQFLTRSPYSALFFMTDSAFHYYLPLFMIQALLDYENADSAAITISFTEPNNDNLQLWTKSHWAQVMDDFLTGATAKRERVDARYKMLSREQLRVLRDFMEYIKRVYGPNYGWSHGEDRILEKLETLLQS